MVHHRIWLLSSERLRNTWNWTKILKPSNFSLSWIAKLNWLFSSWNGRLYTLPFWDALINRSINNDTVQQNFHSQTLIIMACKRWNLVNIPRGMWEIINFLTFLSLILIYNFVSRKTQVFFSDIFIMQST